MEHLPFDRYKRAIVKCYRHLKPGDWFLVAEGYAKEGSDMLQRFFEEMESWKKEIDQKISNFVARLRDEKETLLPQQSREGSVMTGRGI